MSLIASDGYEYEDIGQRIIGDKLHSEHNLQAAKLLWAGYTRQGLQNYAEGVKASRAEHSVEEVGYHVSLEAIRQGSWARHDVAQAADSRRSGAGLPVNFA